MLARANSCRNCKIGDTEAGAIATAISRNRSFRIVNLDFNKIADEGAVAIANALKENGLIHELTLRSNRIGDIGARALVECPSLAKFKYVGPYACVVSILSGLLTSCTVNEASMLQSHVAPKICHNAHSFVLISRIFCSLRENRVGKLGAIAIANALQQNTRIRELKYDNWHVSKPTRIMGPKTAS
eukprot:m.823299 g.823299  ORF g.823299 m.823299 type:complete len:186 (-) comp23402_c0_seq124:1945-2502(-)